MSVETAFGENLNKKFDAQETLPPSIRVSSFRGTYADYLIISIHTLITGSKGRLDAIYPALLAIVNNIAPHAQHLSSTTSSKLLQLFASMSAPSFLLANETNHALLQSLMESINAAVEHQYPDNPNLIFAILKSRKRFEALRAFTLESGQQEIERIARRRKEILSGAPEMATSPTRIEAENDTIRSPASRSNSTSLANVPEEDGRFAIGDSEDSDDELHNQATPSQSSPSLRNSRTPSIASSADDSVPIQLRGMSEKARGKMPVGSSSFSRQNSTTSLNNYNITSPIRTTGPTDFTPTSSWIENWLPELPLHTILTLIKALSPHLPPNSTARNNTNANSAHPDTSTSSFLSDIPHTTSHPAIAGILADPSPIRVHTFEWSSLSLGWYESLLWGYIYAAEMVVGTNAPGATATPGAVGVWNGTGVKLFQVQEGSAEGPTWSRPKGAVDVVGNRLVQGVQGLRVGAGRVLSGGAAGGAQSVREV